MTNKPIESFIAGTVEVAVWENQGEDSKIFHTVTAKRSYSDGNGQRKDAGTVSLLPQQIPDLVMALQKSHEFLRMGMRQRRKQAASTSEGPENGSESNVGEDAAYSNSAESQDALADLASENQRQGFVGKVGRQRGSSRGSR